MGANDFILINSLTRTATFDPLVASKRVVVGG